jgi:Holliday junction resolvase
MPKTEQNFEYRIQKLLQSKGYLVINCTCSRPFDLIALKNGECYLIEIKGKNTPYPKEQYERQMKLAKDVGFPFVVIIQGKKKGEFRVEPYQTLTEVFITQVMSRVK